MPSESWLRGQSACSSKRYRGEFFILASMREFSAEAIIAALSFLIYHALREATPMLRWLD
jgi:hypothetical protein